MTNKLLLEILWWLITGLVTFAVLYPIYTTLDSYRFGWINVIYIFTFITLTRHIFLLQLTFLANQEKAKLAIIFLAVPAVFLLIQELTLFQSYINREGLGSLVGALPYDRRTNMINYIRNEMFFFGVGAIISSIVLPFRLILSIWRVRNRGTV